MTRHRPSTLVLWISAPALLVACAREPRTPLTVVLENEVAVADLGQGVDLSLSFETSGLRLITATQDQADVQLSVSADTMASVVFDSPARRAVMERGCLETPAGAVTLRVSSKAASARRDARIRVRVLTIGGESGSLDAAARVECAEGKAAALPETWSEPVASRQAAAYEAAAQSWQSAGNPGRAGAAYLQAGWLLARYGANPLQAITQARRAREAYRLAQDAVGEARATLLFTVPLYELTESGRDDWGKPSDDCAPLLARARGELTRAIATFDGAGDAYFSAEARNQLGYNLYEQALYPDALQAFTDAAEHFRRNQETEGENRALANFYEVLKLNGNYREAAAAFDRLVAARGNVAADGTLADILNNSASTHSAAGEFDRALPQFVRALQIHEANRDLEGMARSLNGLSTAYMRLGAPSAALEYANQSRRVLAQRPGSQGPSSENVELASELLAGNAQRALGDPAAAARSHALALQFARNDITRSQSHLELARDALWIADVKAARSHLDKARQFSAGKAVIRTLEIELESARADLMAGDLATAYSRFAQLEQKFITAGVPVNAVDALQAMARIDLRRGKLANALALNERAVKIFESLRVAIGSPDLRSRMTALHRSAYDQRAEILDAQYREGSRKDENLRARMFAAADEARAGLVHEMDPRGLPGVGAPSEPALRDLTADIALLENQLAAVRSGGGADTREPAVRDSLARLRARFDAMSQPEKIRPTRFDPREYRFDDLRPDTAILLFVETGSVVRRYVITTEGIDEPGDLAAADLAQRLRAATPEPDQNPSPRRMAAAYAEMARLLLPPVDRLANRPHLVVIASAGLADAPFATLPLPTDSQPLIAHHDVTMALSLRDALRIARRPVEERRVDLARVAVFFDPVFTSNDARVVVAQNVRRGLPTMPRLAGTVIEARSIREQLKGIPLDEFSAFEATREQALSPRVSTATVLHFATHAIAGDQWPTGSGLQLTSFAKDGAPLPGFVSTLDLLSRRSAANLVVLSACDTARGDAAPSESVAGLARAFLGTGALRVVATRRAVEDSVTALLMREFYAGIAAGLMPSVALSQAQWKTLQIAGPASAPDWSAFVLYERAPEK